MNEKLKVLLRDYGYKVCGNELIQTAYRQMPQRAVRRCRDVIDAAEQLIPIIRDDAFYSRYQEITNQ